MVRNTKEGQDDSQSETTNWARRNLMRLGAAGIGLSASGMSVAGQEADDNTPTPDNGTQTPTESAEDEHFLADIVDPVFGYALASGETDDIEIDHVVDVTAEEGQGPHPDFPQEPDENAPGSIVELPVEFFFDPVGLHVEPDDLVHFTDVTGLHTVTAFHEKFQEPFFDMPTRVPDGVPGFTSPPLVPGESWVYQFTEPGVYDYFCFPHLGLGMVGRIVVFDPEEDDIDSDEFAEPTTDELFDNDQRVLGAEALNPGTIVDEGSVAWADLELASQ